MKKLSMVALVLLISIAFMSSGCARSKEAPEKAPAKEDSEKVAPEKPAAKQKPKVSGFVGKVTMISAGLIQVKGKKGPVTFDASNPDLRGYNDIGDVRVGDTVAAKYTKDGIIITKFKGQTKAKAVGERKTEKAKKARKEKAASLASRNGTGPYTASFDELTVEDHALKVINKSEEGGSGLVTSTPAGISCSTGRSTGCEDFFVYGEEVALSASADTGSIFIGWRPALKCPGTGNCAVTIDRKRTITAVFTKS